MVLFKKSMKNKEDNSRTIARTMYDFMTFAEAGPWIP